MPETVYRCASDDCDHYDDECTNENIEDIKTRWDSHSNLVGCLDGYEKEEHWMNSKPIKVTISKHVRSAVEQLADGVGNVKDNSKFIRELLCSISLRYAEEMKLDIESLKKLGGVLQHYFNELNI